MVQLKRLTAVPEYDDSSWGLTGTGPIENRKQRLTASLDCNHTEADCQTESQSEGLSFSAPVFIEHVIKHKVLAWSAEQKNPACACQLGK